MDGRRYFPVAMASLKGILLSTSWGVRCIKKWGCGYDSGKMLTNGCLKPLKKIIDLIKQELLKYLHHRVNERMSPNKGPFQKERLVFQPLVF